MSTQRISAVNFETWIGDTLTPVTSMTLNITDDGGVQQTNGMPDGWTQGALSADGEIVLALSYLKTLQAQAEAAGSWEGIDAIDIVNVAAVGNGSEFKVSAYGCKLKISALLNKDQSSNENARVTLPLTVTSPRFIEINGVPYAAKERTTFAEL